MILRGYYSLHFIALHGSLSPFVCTWVIQSGFSGGRTAMTSIRYIPQANLFYMSRSLAPFFIVSYYKKMGPDFLVIYYWDWTPWSTSLVASSGPPAAPSVSQGQVLATLYFSGIRTSRVFLFVIYRRRTCGGTGHRGALHGSLPQERCSTAWPPAAYDRVIHIEIFNHVTARDYSILGIA